MEWRATTNGYFHHPKKRNTSNKYGVSFWGKENVLELVVIVV